MKSKTVVVVVVAAVLIASLGLLGYLATRPRDRGPVVTDPRVARDFEERGVGVTPSSSDARSSTTPTAVPTPPDDPAQDVIESLVAPLAQQVLDAECVPSMVVGVVQNGRSFVFGYGDVDGTGAPPDADTIFEIGSITKVFTGVLLAEAFVRSEVGLEDPIDGALPEGMTGPRDRDGTGITFEQLARHSSGLPRLPTGIPVMSIDPYRDFSRDDLYAFIDGLRLRRAPGSGYEYSNLGTGLLGTLLSAIAQTSYPDLLRERLTGPLGMDTTTVAGPDATPDGLAQGHFAGEPVPAWRFDSLAGAGAVRSSAADMLRFASACIHPSKHPDVGPILTMAMEEQAATPGGPTVGLGWHLAGDGETLWHNGGTGGFSTMLLVGRERELAVLVMANGSDDVITSLGNAIFIGLAGGEPPDLGLRPSVALSEDQIEHLVGTYASEETGMTLELTRDGEGLAGLLTAQEKPWRARPVGERSIENRALGIECTFEGEGERPNVAVLRMGGMSLRMERVE